MSSEVMEFSEHPGVFLPTVSTFELYHVFNISSYISGVVGDGILKYVGTFTI